MYERLREHGDKRRKPPTSKAVQQNNGDYLNCSLRLFQKTHRCCVTIYNEVSAMYSIKLKTWNLSVSTTVTNRQLNINKYSAPRRFSSLTFQHLYSTFNNFIIAHQVTFLHHAKGTRTQIFGNFKVRSRDFRPLTFEASLRRNYTISSRFVKVPFTIYSRRTTCSSS